MIKYCHGLYRVVYLVEDDLLLTLKFELRFSTRRSNWILHRKRKYYICCLIDGILKIERDLSNSI